MRLRWALSATVSSSGSIWSPGGAAVGTRRDRDRQSSRQASPSATHRKCRAAAGRRSEPQCCCRGRGSTFYRPARPSTARSAGSSQPPHLSPGQGTVFLQSLLQLLAARSSLSSLCPEDATGLHRSTILVALAWGSQKRPDNNAKHGRVHLGQEEERLEEGVVVHLEEEEEVILPDIARHRQLAWPVLNGGVSLCRGRVCRPDKARQGTAAQTCSMSPSTTGTCSKSSPLHFA